MWPPAQGGRIAAGAEGRWCAQGTVADQSGDGSQGRAACTVASGVVYHVATVRPAVWDQGAAVQPVLRAAPAAHGPYDARIKSARVACRPPVRRGGCLGLAPAPARGRRLRGGLRTCGSAFRPARQRGGWPYTGSRAGARGRRRGGRPTTSGWRRATQRSGPLSPQRTGRLPAGRQGTVRPSAAGAIRWGKGARALLPVTGASPGAGAVSARPRWRTGERCGQLPPRVGPGHQQ